QGNRRRLAEPPVGGDRRRARRAHRDADRRDAGAAAGKQLEIRAMAIDVSAKTMPAELLSGHPAFGNPWYYEMELAPGVFSPGREQRSVAQTRELLRRTDVTGASCLDLGIQEGLVTTLLVRRGGAEVVGYDRIL